MQIETPIALHDVDMLSVVFEELLQDHQTSRDSAAAEGILARLIFTYDLGVRDPVLLKMFAVPFLRQRLTGTQ
ncbi:MULTISPECIES: hypothetical protein [Sinorhizobium]|uniref:Uncharacterized protein n=2 Tax=Sinorhizobium TaxID=28105 RepID=A0A2S3YNQ5_9HYPH|nr:MULTISPECIES: hypothetical protein [Sinorhizobium]ASY56349.1 hypothetical protein SS05631_c14110 [Sinorhizobium sp. CCBAU 05631]AUX76284.1 hypothetical protein NXT3_CH01711 [Sinorhizobium fredii]PDT42638.1 hypothetical protein CO656_02855 [Sinorhizobium sp. FG01]PDT55123.1 hypothetical protein CO664_08715 [Sinorhizobium sp. NG07B]POH32167.1 hypothetical protein ATY30_12325 [Sinorhizobium americanum]